MQLVTGLMLFSVLFPAKTWFPPNQPLSITIKADAPAMLVLTEFTGKPIDPKAPIEVAPAQQIDLRTLYPDLATPGTYVLYAVPKGKPITQFTGTPLVIGSRADKRPGAPAGTMITKVEPLRYALMSTDQGDMVMAFYYDVAPNTASAILTLAEQGFYDGLTFHRIIPGFVIQGGDPRADGTGGPGFQIDAEFNDRKHEEGVLSMARNGDPLEAQGAEPRGEFANSAGSQFFLCLGRVEHLDRRYTAFGKVVQGIDTLRKIAAVPIADKRTGRPEKPPVITSVQVLPVTADKNPYPAIMDNLKLARDLPSTRPAQ